jgi:hypothetical protein
MIWLPLMAAFALVGGAGAATTPGFKQEYERWMNKAHPELQRDSAAGVDDKPTGPLRVAKPGGKPLWMEDTDELDPRCGVERAGRRASTCRTWRDACVSD